MIREVLRQDGIVIAMGLICGAMAVFESWTPAIAAAGAAMLIVSMYRPVVPITMAFLGILLDAQGMFSARVLGVPVTVSKIAVLFAITSHIVNSLVRRRAPIIWTPVTSGWLGILATMVASLIAAIDPSWGYTDTVGVLMLGFMTHLIYRAVDEEAMPWMVRFMGGFTILFLLWTLFTQRKEGWFATLNQSWQQRTSGAFGDPNAWSTALIVICPMLIAGLAADKHRSATPLFVGLLVTFPACILQSMSRAGLLAFVVITPGLVYALRDRRWWLGVAGAALLPLIPFILNVEAVLLRYRTLLDPTLESDLGHGSLRERAALLEAGIQIFLDHPWLGVGTGLFRIHASYVSAGEVWKIAHNSYINVAAEQGIPGLIVHAFFGVQLYRAAWNAATRAHTPYFRAIGQGFFLSLLGFSAMAFTLNLATFASAWYMLSFGLVAGRLGRAELMPDRTERAVKPSTPLAGSPA
jgi:O-antigen ligase